MTSKTKFLALCALPFLLSGCGEGFEMIKTDSMFPYGNQRTAGSGYAYVLAKMLPEKELVTTPVKRDWKPEIMEMLPKSEPAPEPVLQEADEIFLEDGKK